MSALCPTSPPAIAPDTARSERLAEVRFAGDFFACLQLHRLDARPIPARIDPEWRPWELLRQLQIESAGPLRRAAVMHLQTYRDEDRSRHFDLVGNHWSIDLVTVTAAGVLLVGFVCAIVTLLAR